MHVLAGVDRLRLPHWVVAALFTACALHWYKSALR